MDVQIIKSKRIRDNRGYLVDFLKGDDLNRNDKKFGQIYFLTFENKNVIRGNHYHTEKREWFVVSAGKVKVILEDVKSKERKNFIINGDKDSYERISIGPNIAHSFKSLTHFASMVNYCNKPYHKGNPDSINYILM